MDTKRGHRSEIDGLRALCVLAVVGFHANVPHLSGGFVGVDAFFVISGYLITGLIAGRCRDGSFSFRDFYARRILRIVPALTVVTAAALAAGWLWLFPAEFRAASASALWATLSLSNVHFYETIGYFDPNSASRPLLNTWSLGIEEQFYLAYPVLLLALARLPRAASAWCLAALLAASLAVSQWQASSDPSAAFYLLPSRFWELLVGGLAALSPPRLAAAFRRVPGLPEVGIAMVAASVVAYTGTTPFPGLHALPPCLGTALFLVSTDGRATRSPAMAALRLAPVTYVGLVSYSLYLWHWPFIVYQRIGPIVHTGLSPSLDKACVFGLMFAASCLSYHFVETPFRTGAVFRDRGRRVRLVMAGTAACAACMALPLAAGGFPGRFGPEALRFASYLSYDPARGYREGTCFLDNSMPFSLFDRERCLGSGPGPSVLLVGDSHAAQLYPGLAAAAGSGVAVLQATSTGCKPLLRDVGAGTTCGLMDGFVLREYLPTHHPDKVVVSARWSPEDLPSLVDTVVALRGMGQDVTVLGPTPEFTQPLPRLLARAASGAGSDPASYLYPGPKSLDAEMARALVPTGASYVSMYDAVERAGHGKWLVDGAPVFFDASHLTAQGSAAAVGTVAGSLVPGGAGDAKAGDGLASAGR